MFLNKNNIDRYCANTDYMFQGKKRNATNATATIPNYSYEVTKISDLRSLRIFKGVHDRIIFLDILNIHSSVCQITLSPV